MRYAECGFEIAPRRSIRLVEDDMGGGRCDESGGKQGYAKRLQSFHVFPLSESDLQPGKDATALAGIKHIGCSNARIGDGGVSRDIFLVGQVARIEKEAHTTLDVHAALNAD